MSRDVAISGYDLASFARAFSENESPILADGYAALGDGWSLYCLVLGDDVPASTIRSALTALSGSLFPSPSYVSVDRADVALDDLSLSIEVLTVITRLDDPSVIHSLEAAFKPGSAVIPEPSIVSFFLRRLSEIRNVR